jgi:hypothetical protein
MRGRARRVIRQVMTLRGFLGLIIAIGIIGFWLFAMVVTSLTRAQTAVPYLEETMPFIILAMTVMSLFGPVGEMAVHFSPSETNFLFPAPYSRRDLLAYRIVSHLQGVAFMALFFSIYLQSISRWWPATFMGTFLAFLFVHLTVLTLRLLAENIGQQAYSRGRIAGLMLLAIIALVLIWRSLTWPDMEGSYESIMEPVRSSWPGFVILTVLAPFGHAAAAANIVQFLPWAGLALLMNGAMFGVIMALDANYYESAIRVSQKKHARMRRVQRGQYMPNLSTLRLLRIRILPRWGGIGPTLWRQITRSLRNVLSLVYLSVIVALIVGFICGGAVMSGYLDGSSDDHLHLIWGLTAGILMWMTMIFAGAVPFDFRGDVEQLEYIKTLPLHPMALATGQVATPTLIMTVLHGMMLTAAATFSESYILIPIGLLIVIPVNAMLFTLENIFFLLSPARTVSRGMEGLYTAARQVISMAVKTLVIGLGLALALAAGTTIYFVLGEQWIVIGAVVWCIFAAEGLVMVAFLAWVFHRMEPSLQSLE